MQIEVLSAVLDYSGVIGEPKRSICEERHDPLPPPEDRDIEWPDTEGAMQPGPDEERHSWRRLKRRSTEDVSREEATNEEEDVGGEGACCHDGHSKFLDLVEHAQIVRKRLDQHVHVRVAKNEPHHGHKAQEIKHSKVALVSISLFLKEGLVAGNDTEREKTFLETGFSVVVISESEGRVQLISAIC